MDERGGDFGQKMAGIVARSSLGSKEFLFHYVRTIIPMFAAGTQPRSTQPRSTQQRPKVALNGKRPNRGAFFLMHGSTDIRTYVTR